MFCFFIAWILGRLKLLILLTFSLTDTEYQILSLDGDKVESDSRLSQYLREHQSYGRSNS